MAAPPPQPPNPPNSGDKLPAKRGRQELDLSDVDLAALDLDGLDLDEDADDESPWAAVLRGLIFVLLLAGGAGILILPSTEIYRSYGHANWFFFVIAIAGTGIGVGLGRMFLEWSQRAAQRYAARVGTLKQRPAEPKKPASPLVRWLTILAAIGAAAAIVVGVPASSYFTGGSSYTSSWLLGAAGAIVVGVLAGRWITMQAEAAAERDRKAPQESRAPIQWPPWFKWVTLGVIVVLSIIAAFGLQLFGGTLDGSMGFSLGGVGFVVGIMAAIWLARRFDEAEKKFRAEKEQNRARRL